MFSRETALIEHVWVEIYNKIDLYGYGGCLSYDVECLHSAENMSDKTSKYLSKTSLCPGLYCKINLPFLTWKCASTLSRVYSLNLGWWGWLLGLFWRQLVQVSSTSLRLLFNDSVVSNSVTPRTPACQGSLPFTISKSLLNSCPLSWWCHLTISSSVAPFSSCLQSFPASGSFQWVDFSHGWPNYWGFSFSISSSNEYSELISFRIDWFDLLAVQQTQDSSSTTVWKHQFFGAQPSLWSNSLYDPLLEWVVISSSRESSQLRDQTYVSCVSYFGRGIPYHWHRMGIPVEIGSSHGFCWTIDNHWYRTSCL